MTAKPPEKSTPKAHPRSQATAPGGPNVNAGEPWGWTRRQRVGLGALLAVLLAFLLVQYVRRPQSLDGPAGLGVDQSILPQYMDPNTASAAELARIPHLGDAIAAKIVAYREARKQATTDGIVFRQATDLAKIPGIGTRLSAEFAPFFKFPEPDTPATSTQP